MLKILGEFQEDQILSIYVIDDVWEFMNAMKVCWHYSSVMRVIPRLC